jgi:hypothetical protein
MVICIEVSDRTKLQLDSLVEIGKYQDYSEAVSVAISNQLVLQRQVSKSGSVVLPGKSDHSTDPGTKRSTRRIVLEDERSFESEVPALFSLRGADNRPREAAPWPDDVFVPGQRVPIDRWIFGQHNKLLPAKASCRAIASLLNEAENSSQGVLLSKATAEIAEHAVRLGDYLRFLDKKFELNRDDAYSTAFPYSGAESEDKARLRYASQFVTAMSKQGRLTGILVDLKLINLPKNKGPRILLTQAGWDLAQLPNAVLDSRPHEIRPAKLNEDEQNVLLAHISRHVPVEDFAYRTILGAISDGADTPQKLNAILKRHLSTRSEKPFTDAFLTTQRSGAISRMADLGLVDRVRDSIRVTYVVTKRGAIYAQEQAAGVGQ